MVESNEIVPFYKTKWMFFLYGVIVVILFYTFFVDNNRSISGQVTKDETINVIEDKWAVYTAFEEEEERIKEMLEDDGYEIISIFIMNHSTESLLFKTYNISDDTDCLEDEICYTKKLYVSIKAKSLGDMDNQVMDFIITSYTIMPNAYNYYFEILTPTQTCEFTIFGNIVRGHFGKINYESGESVLESYSKEAYELLLKNIELFKECN